MALNPAKLSSGELSRTWVGEWHASFMHDFYAIELTTQMAPLVLSLSCPGGGSSEMYADTTTPAPTAQRHSHSMDPDTGTITLPTLQAIPIKDDGSGVRTIFVSVRCSVPGENDKACFAAHPPSLGALFFTLALCI
jgi:hypothetical protein